MVGEKSQIETDAIGDREEKRRLLFPNKPGDAETKGHQIKEESNSQSEGKRLLIRQSRIGSERKTPKRIGTSRPAERQSQNA